MRIIRAISLLSLPVALNAGLIGCRYEGGFMQMDSNSTLPFFGLQLSVDSGSRPDSESKELQKLQRSQHNSAVVRLASLNR